MILRPLFIFAILLISSACLAAEGLPNIIFILADDLGYGDLQCLNPERCKIATPNLDQMAADGKIFTDAHTSSAVCTPTRYGILTGRYNWRTHLQKSVLYGYSKPLISDDRITVGHLMQNTGYRTGAIGKWHLGMDMPFTDDRPVKNHIPVNMDWTGKIKNGPVDRGFDYFYGISASLDMPPYIYIDNDHFVGECTTQKKWMRTGPAHEDFEAVDVLPKIAEKTVEFIQAADSEKPFFAYVAFTSPHTPIVPSPEWKGKSDIGSYGDFVMQTDDAVGTILKGIADAGVTENTLVIFSTDNGCSKAAKIDKMQAKGHFPSAQFRGSKADLWDGGHRVPFIVRWPAVIKAGTECHETICLNDLMATCADIAGNELPETAGEDSVSFLPALSGEPIVSTRKGLIHHSISGHFAYRQGKWKLLLAKGSAGWTSPSEKQMPAGSPIAQLYDMQSDPGETNNLYDAEPEIAEQLLKLLEDDIARGRSTAGPDLKNDVKKIVLWKSGKE